MVSSFVVSIVLLILNKNGIQFSTHVALIITIIFTSISWIVTAFLAPQTDEKVLIEFYKKVKPFGPGWKYIKEKSGVTFSASEIEKENIPLSLLGWISGTITIWSSLFTIGSFLYGRTEMGFLLLGVFLISGFVLLNVIKKIWK